MTIFGYTLRKPWIKYFDMEFDLGQQLVGAIKQAAAAEYVATIIANDLCDDECEVLDYIKKTVKP
jgi:hypothetical protein